jgi:hypothetical protein
LACEIIVQKVKGTKMRKTLLIISVFSLLTVVIWPRTAGSVQTNYDKSSLATDQEKGTQLAKKFSTIQVLAPLAPVALSPFFGITCLSGTSILCNMGVLPKNEFLMGNKALNNWLVFGVFLILSIATSLPKMTAVSKGFGQAIDQLETYAGIISYFGIYYLSSMGQDEAAKQVVYAAGIISFTKGTLLMIAAAINIIVINTVKYFFELLIWISPIPALDAMFEAANKTVTAVLAAVYAFNPYLAMILNIILFLICLVIFNWARRNVSYFKAMLIEPIIAKLLGKTNVSTPPHIKAKISVFVEQGEPLLKVFPTKKIRKIKKKEMCYLTTGKAGLFLVKLRLIRQPKIEKLETANAQIELIAGLISNTIEIASQEITKPVVLAFSKIYNKQIESFAAVLRPFGRVNNKCGAEDTKAAGTSPAQHGIA